MTNPAFVWILPVPRDFQASCALFKVKFVLCQSDHVHKGQGFYVLLPLTGRLIPRNDPQGSCSVNMSTATLDREDDSEATGLLSRYHGPR